MKKCLCLLLSLTVFIFAGCDRDTYSVYEKINDIYFDTPAYKASGSITYYTNKTSNTYAFKEYFNGENVHLIHYTDDDLKVYVRDDGVYTKYSQNEKAVRISDTDEGYKHIFPDCFFEKYYSKETSSLEDNPRYIFIQTDNFSRDVSSVKMWIDSKSVTPHRMEIYGSESQLLCKVIFDRFSLNVETDEKLFMF